MKEYVYMNLKTNAIEMVKDGDLTDEHLEFFINKVLKTIDNCPKEIIPTLIKELSK